MRESTARCSLMVLAVFLLGLVLASAELVSPSWVDCRESVRFREDGGDPDMPDCSMGGSRSTVDTAPLPSGPARPAGGPSCFASDIQPSEADRSGAVSVEVERRVLIFRLWSSVASLVIAF